MAIFLLATLGCALSTHVWVFLTFRMLQAAVVVAMVLSRAIVRDMVPEAQAASMIGYVTMGMAVVPMIGPAIGGALDQWLGWQSTFALVFLLGLGVFWLTWADLGETAPAESRNMTLLATGPRLSRTAHVAALLGLFAGLGPLIGIILRLS